MAQYASKRQLQSIESSCCSRYLSNGCKSSVEILVSNLHSKISQRDNNRSGAENLTYSVDYLPIHVGFHLTHNGGGQPRRARSEATSATSAGPSS